MQPRKALNARTADKYVLYQTAVQDPAADVGFIDRIVTRDGRPAPRTLREDFCGTAMLCAEWVESKRDRFAVGLDLDPEPLAWGRAHNIEALGTSAVRV